MAFESSEEVSEEGGIILIVFSISSSKSSRINLPDSIVGSSGLSIIIIISFNSFSSSFRLKKTSLLKTIFFLGRTSLSCGNQIWYILVNLYLTRYPIRARNISLWCISRSRTSSGMYAYVLQLYTLRWPISGLIVVRPRAFCRYSAGDF